MFSQATAYLAGFSEGDRTIPHHLSDLPEGDESAFACGLAGVDDATPVPCRALSTMEGSAKPYRAQRIARTPFPSHLSARYDEQGRRRID